MLASLHKLACLYCVYFPWVQLSGYPPTLKLTLTLTQTPTVQLAIVRIPFVWFHFVPIVSFCSYLILISKRMHSDKSDSNPKRLASLHSILAYQINFSLPPPSYYWLTVGKPSFSSNVVEEIRPGCRNLQRSLIVVNLSGIFVAGIQYKCGLSELKFGLVCGFKKMVSSRISSIEVGVGKLVLVKCSQTLSN